MKKLLANRILWIVVAVLVLLGVIFFPHTSRTKVNGELTGVYSTIEERYFLHNLVELKTTNVCISGNGVTERVVQIDYKLNGDIKKISTEFCDNSTTIAEYSDGKYLVKETSLNIVGTGLRTSVIEYNDVGLEVYSESFMLGVSTVTHTTYNEKNEMEKRTSETHKLEELFESVETNYLEDNSMESTQKRYDYGELVFESYMLVEDFEIIFNDTKEYEDGVLVRQSVFEVSALETIVSYNSVLDSIVFSGDCDENGLCRVESFVTPDFELEFIPYGYPLEGGDYELLRVEDSIMLPIATYMFEFSKNTDLQSYVESLEQYILEQIE